MANFFKVNDRLFIVDLPGYGFSSTGNREHQDWQDLMNAYLSRSVIVKFIFLWDPRRDFDDTDYQLALALGERAPVVLVLTKTDKLSRQDINQRKKFLEHALKSRGVRVTSTHAVSALKKSGMEHLREDLGLTQSENRSADR